MKKRCRARHSRAITRVTEFNSFPSRLQKSVAGSSMPQRPASVRPLRHRSLSSPRDVTARNQRYHASILRRTLRELVFAHDEICTCIAGFPTRALIRGWSLGSDPSDGSQSPCPFCLSIRRLNPMIWVLEQSRGRMPRNEISSDRESVHSRWRITKFGGATLLHAKSQFGGCARTPWILTKSTTSVGIAVVGDNAVTPSGLFSSYNTYRRAHKPESRSSWRGGGAELFTLGPV